MPSDIIHTHSPDLAALTKKILSCTVCEYKLPLGAKPIVQLNSKAKILIASQAPGSFAHASGTPFKDKSGERLRLWMGIEDDDFYDPQKVAILPIGFCYPGRGNSGDLPPTKECAPLWREKVLALLPNIELTLLIGAYAQQWHFSYAQIKKPKTLTETVKQWPLYWPSIIPLPHPSPRNNIWMSKHSWFEQEVLPQLSKRVNNILTPHNLKK